MLKGGCKNERGVIVSDNDSRPLLTNGSGYKPGDLPKNTTYH